MSIKEEQLQEIEAITSIYPDEIAVLSEDPYPKFNLMIKPTTNDEDDFRPFLLLEIKFHEHYPDQSPEIAIVDSVNVDDRSVFESEIKTICAENLARQREAIERKIREEEEAEQKRFEGTCVSVESFIKWKVKFDAERAELIKTVKVDESEPKKLTGRQLFEKDRSLYDSDIKFISGEGGEVVEVDESLFEDMLDLEFDDAGTTGIDLSDVDQ
ncbi:unnamed protein product [Rotaria socialis]